jgi:hypothetical protein
MKRHVQLVHRTVSLVDRAVDHALIVEPQRIEPPPASIQEVQHRPDSVPKRFGLLDRQARAFHEYTEYQYTVSLSSGI